VAPEAEAAPTRELIRTHGLPVAVVAAGGVLGALGRYGAGLVWPTAAGTFPTTTFVINAVGSALIGVVVVLFTEVWSAPALVHPFLVTGVLGGFTTFSTYSVDTERLLQDGRSVLALAYAALTLVVAIAAVAAATLLTRRASRRARQVRR
jgi:CrcB protein